LFNRSCHFVCFSSGGGRFTAGWEMEIVGEVVGAFGA